MPPADQDGKNTAPGLASPVADVQAGADDFDWDKAIDDWDPTFVAEASSLPPDLAGVGKVLAELPPDLAGIGRVVADPGPALEPAAALTAEAPVAPALVAAAPVAPPADPPLADAPSLVSAEPEPAPLVLESPLPSSQSPVDSGPLPPVVQAAPPTTAPPAVAPPPAVKPVVAASDAAPLPPPPPASLSHDPLPIQIDIDLSKVPRLAEQVETTLAMDAREMDRLAAMLRHPDLMPISKQRPAPRKVERPIEVEEEFEYDNMVVGEASEASTAVEPPLVTAPPAAASEPPAATLAPPISGRAEPLPPPPVEASAPTELNFEADFPTDYEVETSAGEQSAAASILATASVAATAAVGPPLAAPAVVASPTAVAGPEVAATPVAAVAAAPAVAVLAAAVGVAPPASLAAAPAAAATGTALVTRRLPLPSLEQLPAPLLSSATGTIAPEAATRRLFLALLDGEAAVEGPTDRRRAARLAVAAARQSEALRETADALDRYRAAIDSAGDHRPALRGSRRLLAWPGPTAQPDEATALLERELARSSASERLGLLLSRSELLRSQGQLSDAKRSYQDALPPGQPATAPGRMVALLGLLDVATSQATPTEVASNLDAILNSFATKGALRAALQIERARHDEVLGRDAAASSRFESVFSENPTAGSLSAGLGWLRTAARTPAGKEGSPLLRAYQALLGTQLPLGLQAAIARQVALAQPPNSAGRLAALAGAERSSDWLLLEELAISQEQAGDPLAAATTFLRLAEVAREPLQRSLALCAAADAQLRGGQPETARRSLLQAQKIAAAGDLEFDAIAAQTLKRLGRSLDKLEDRLALFSADSGQPADQAAYAHTQAAHILLARPAPESRRSEGLAELSAALTARPDYLPAVQLLSDLYVADGRFADAAQVLLRAAPALAESGDPRQGLLARSYAEEAARLLTRAGQPLAAARVLVRELSQGPQSGASSLQPALRAQLASLCAELAGHTDVTLAEQVAGVLAQDAQQTPHRHRAAALWYRRGLLLLPHHPQAANSLGPVEQSFEQALLTMPGHGPALLALHLRALAVPGDALQHSRLAHSLLDALRKRMDGATGRSEAMLWALRLAAAQEHEGRDAAAALQTYKHLRTFAPDHSALLGLEDTLFVTAWRAGQTLELIDRQLAGTEDLEQRYALQLLAGEQLEAQGHQARAAERFSQALELRPGHPVGKAALVRAYRTGGLLDELTKFTAAELKDATDVQTRVAAFDRQALLAQLRGGGTGSEAAMNAYRNILAVDTSNHAAMRALERHFIASQQWGELVHLYEQMGLCATDTAFAVHLHLDRARLRQRLVWQGKNDESTLTNELANDFRLALYRDRHSRPAMRFLLTAALSKRDHAQVATLSTAVAETCVTAGDYPGTETGDGRSAAIFMTRAAEALAADGREPEEVLQAFQTALKHLPDHLPALRGLTQYAVVQSQFALAADGAEALVQNLRSPDERYLCYMLAGVVAQELLKDLPRARRAFLAGLRLLPERDEAFERLRHAFGDELKSRDGAMQLSQLISERLQQHSDPAPHQVALRLELAQLLLGPIGDRPRAKLELRAAVEQAPNNAAALYALGKLLADDEEWQPAVELLERYSKLEQRPTQLIGLHLLLAEIYSDQLKDTHRALPHFTRVLQLQPQNQQALSKLADIFMAQHKPAGALPILRRLVKYTDDKAKKIGYYHQIAGLCELAGDTRGALEALRQALEADALHLPTIGELARFYDRQKDEQSMRILLDRAASRFRPLLREKPRDQTVLQGLLQLYVWRRATDQASMVAGVLTALGATIPPEVKAQMDKLPARKEPTRDGLRSPAVDDILYPARVAPGFRTLFKLLFEPLNKLYGTDQKKLATLGVDKREKLPRSGHPVRDQANKLAADLGVGDFDLYVTAATRVDEEGKKLPLCTIEPTDPPALIIHSTLLEGPEAERRFLLGGLLKLLQSSLVLPLSMSTDELGLLVGALVRQYVPTYSPIGYADKRVVNEAARVKKVIPSKLTGQLMPHALECASESLDFEGIAEALLQCAHHAGLVWTADVASAMSALRRRGASSERYIDDLLRFAVSDEFSELRRLVTS